MAGFFDVLSNEDSKKYACGSPIQPQNGAVFAPFAEIGFIGKDKKNVTTITVGNRSSKNSKAIIKSLEYGFTEGAGVKVEIVDEQGSNIGKFLDKLNKTLSNSNHDYRMIVDFGWIITDCNGNQTIDSVSKGGFVSGGVGSTFGFLYFLPMKIDASYEGGKAKYTIEGNDLQDRIGESRINEIFGREDNKISIKQAIRDLFKNGPVKIDVVFERKDGTEWEFANSDGGPNGPKTVYTSDQQNGLATTRKWLSSLTTSDGKGVVFQWDQSRPSPTLVLLEDVNPAPNENDPMCKNSIGTYIVNGGNYSPVLSFSPQINWKLSTGADAHSNSGAVSAGGASVEGGQGIEKGGTQTMYIPSQNELDTRSAADIAKLGTKAVVAHGNATRFREIPHCVEAELKIIGDPRLSLPLGANGMVAKKVSIVVINPFFIQSTQKGCEWLAVPNCNETLSNKNWMIKGVNHQIKEGSFVTILKLYLVMPNSELAAGTPIGGVGSGGPTLDNDKKLGV